MEIIKNDFIKSIIWKICKSLFLTISISILFGLFFFNVGYNFYISSIFFFIIQIIGFYFYGDYIKRKTAFQEAELQLKMNAELKKISADVTCPCDKKVQMTIPINMNEDNFYTCSQCNKKVTVLVETKTALRTDPIDVNGDILAHPVIIKEVEERIKDPKHNDRI
jgi:hypothetical protein